MTGCAKVLGWLKFKAWACGLMYVQHMLVVSAASNDRQ